MRVGLSKRLELRVGGDGFLSQRVLGEKRVFGYSDVELAVKILLFDQGRHRPALSLIPILSAPLGSRLFESKATTPVKVAQERPPKGNFSLGGNANFSSLTTPDGRFLQTAFSASLGHSLGHGFAGFWEIFGFTPGERRARLPGSATAASHVHRQECAGRRARRQTLDRFRSGLVLGNGSGGASTRMAILPRHRGQVLTADRSHYRLASANAGRQSPPLAVSLPLGHGENSLLDHLLSLNLSR